MKLGPLLLLLMFSFPWPLFAEVQLHGAFVQGGLIRGHTQPGHHILLNDQPIAVSLQGDFIFGFGRDAELHHHLKEIDAQGRISEQTVTIEPRHYQIERVDGISEQMMHPSKEQLKRIKAESALVKDARTKPLPLQHFSETFIWPTCGRISGIYGSQRIFNGEPRRPHFGIDIAVPAGTPIKAPAGGVVTLAHEGMFYSGKTLIVDHGMGLSSTFLHLSAIDVKVGDQVAQGDIIAKVGASGRVTGPHLDWRVNWFQTRLDPSLLVPEMPMLQ